MRSFNHLITFWNDDELPRLQFAERSRDSCYFSCVICNPPTHSRHLRFSLALYHLVTIILPIHIGIGLGGGEGGVEEYEG